MKIFTLPSAATLAAVFILGGTVLADSPVNQTAKRKEKIAEPTVFVTGSLIPQRIKLEPLGATTFSPVRIIDRREVDGTGRHTTAGVLVYEPSLRIVGH